MALFYAAECGLKLLYMNDRSIPTTRELKSSLKQDLGTRYVEMHNLEILCDLTSVLPVDIGVPPQFSTGGDTHELFRIHEAASALTQTVDSHRAWDV